MSADIKDSLASIADISFEAVTSKTMDESEKYHANIMRTHIIEQLETELRKAISRRSNTICILLDKPYRYDKPQPDVASPVIAQTEKALNELPWIAHAYFSFERHSGGALHILIQDPETKKRLFPSDGIGDPIQYYEGERPKQVEQAVKPKALPPPGKQGLLYMLGMRKAQRAIAPPQEQAKALPAPGKTANQQLSEQFFKHAQDIKDYAAQIPGLNVDFSGLNRALEKIEVLLNAKWEEDVIGAGRSSYRRALHDLKFLSESFKEHAQILSVVNKGRENGEDLQTVSQEQLSGLQRNFENVSRSVENAATRAINARIDRAEIGIAVHDTRLQIQQLRDVELVAPRTAKVTPEM